jgi:hypothetical protein
VRHIAYVVDLRSCYSICEISDSHGGQYEEDSLLGYNCLMMETVHTSEMSFYFNETTRRYIPKGCHFNIEFSQN